MNAMGRGSARWLTPEDEYQPEPLGPLDLAHALAMAEVLWGEESDQAEHSDLGDDQPDLGSALTWDDASTELDDRLRLDPDPLPMIDVFVAAADGDAERLDRLGAGPFENLLGWRPELVPRLAELCRADPGWARVAQGAWLGARDHDRLPEPLRSLVTRLLPIEDTPPRPPRQKRQTRASASQPRTRQPGRRV